MTLNQRDLAMYLRVEIMKKEEQEYLMSQLQQHFSKNVQRYEDLALELNPLGFEIKIGKLNAAKQEPELLELSAISAAIKELENILNSDTATIEEKLAASRILLFWSK